ncbi:MAG: nucleotide exchange factor GrpE [Anaerolineae bacterium]|nr:nucleotide exchange factor GrpE [Anaerolineae bacterium]
MAAERQESVPAEGTSQTGMTAEEPVLVTAEEPKPEALEAEVERLRQELEAAKAQAAEYLDGWQRTQAEFANYRKRQEAEFRERVRLNNAVLIARILPVLDDLERAIQTLPPGLQSLTWVDGVFLIKRKLEVILEAEGLKPIETAGKFFDPLYHEAVTYEDVPGYQEGQNIGEVQRGYMLGERVIRPALVRVARANRAPDSTQQEPV